jgi:hypothetical protein
MRLPLISRPLRPEASCVDQPTPDQHQEESVGIFARFGRRGGKPGVPRQAVSEDRKHLEEFVRTRPGVEAFVEPRTTVTETTVVLVATTGEWTRRRVPSPKVCHEWANALGIPSYDAALVGYPQRMRDWTSARAAEQKRRDAGR